MKNWKKSTGFGIALAGAASIFFIGGLSMRSGAQKYSLVPQPQNLLEDMPELLPVIEPKASFAELPAWAQNMNDMAQLKELFTQLGAGEFYPVVGDPTRVIASLNQADGRDIILEVEHTGADFVIDSWSLRSDNEELQILARKIHSAAPQELGRLVAEIPSMEAAKYKKYESVNGAPYVASFELVDGKLRPSLKSWPTSGPYKREDGLPTTINYLADRTSIEVFKSGNAYVDGIGRLVRGADGKELFQVIYDEGKPVRIQYAADFSPAEFKKYFGNIPNIEIFKGMLTREQALQELANMRGMR